MTTTAGKGLLPDAHPLNLGVSLPFAPVRELAAQADVILAVGSEISETDLFAGLVLPLSGTLIRVDLDPQTLADQYAAAVPLWGDAQATLQSLADALPARRGWGAQSGGAAPLRARIAAGWDVSTRAALHALHSLRAALPADAAVFSDMTQIAYLGNHAFPTDAPGRWFHPSGYGTLGFALPAALGAKLGEPARAVLALAGDFGLQFTLPELLTAVEAQIALPVVVWNNAALGQIRDDMQAAGIPLTGVIARNPDFVALARACGAAAERVHTPAALTATVRDALSASGPTLIEIAAENF